MELSGTFFHLGGTELKWNGTIASTLNVMFDLTIKINWRIPQNVSYTPTQVLFRSKPVFYLPSFNRGYFENSSTLS